MRSVYALLFSSVLFLTGCGKQEPTELKSSGAAPATTAPAMALTINTLAPASTMEKTPFNVQPNGQAALSVTGKDLPVGSTVLWNDQPLATVGTGAWVAAVVPAKLFENPGTAKVKLRGPDGTSLSNELEFTIHGKNGPGPSISKLVPDSTEPGKKFNEQPGGESALSIAGGDIIEGAKLYFDGKPMRTVYGKSSFITAAIPAAAIAKAGKAQVWVVNPDGKASNKVDFTISK